MKFSYCFSVRMTPVGMPVQWIMPSRTVNVSGAQLTLTQPERSSPLNSATKPVSSLTVVPADIRMMTSARIHKPVVFIGLSPTVRRTASRPIPNQNAKRPPRPMSYSIMEDGFSRSNVVLSPSLESRFRRGQENRAERARRPVPSACPRGVAFLPSLRNSRRFSPAVHFHHSALPFLFPIPLDRIGRNHYFPP